MFSTATAMMLAALSAGGSDAIVARQEVDLIELNHLIDDNGRHVFDQLVFYEWSQTRSSYRVIAWRMVKRPGQLPVRSWSPAGYRCVWQDDQVLRQVWSPAYRETWSQTDPERHNRKLFSEALRPELSPPLATRLARLHGSAP